MPGCVKMIVTFNAIFYLRLKDRRPFIKVNVNVFKEIRVKKIIEVLNKRGRILPRIDC